MGVSLEGPLAGAVTVVLGLYLLFAPIERLAQEPSLIKRARRRPIKNKDVPLWMRIFFRTLGVLLIALGAALLRPVFGGA